jgi:hypothetical protein
MISLLLSMRVRFHQVFPLLNSSDALELSFASMSRSRVKYEFARTLIASLSTFWTSSRRIVPTTRILSTYIHVNTNRTILGIGKDFTNTWLAFYFMIEEGYIIQYLQELVRHFDLLHSQ